MAINLSGGRALKSEINVTPFVDVALVLLIIFMVVTPMLERGKDVNLPKAHHPRNDRAETDLVIVSMTSNKQIWVNNVACTEETLAATLGNDLAHSSQRTVLLKADQTLTVGDVKKVLVGMRESGATGVNLGVQEATR